MAPRDVFAATFPHLAELGRQRMRAAAAAHARRQQRSQEQQAAAEAEAARFSIPDAQRIRPHFAQRAKALGRRFSDAIGR